MTKALNIKQDLNILIMVRKRFSIGSGIQKIFLKEELENVKQSPSELAVKIQCLGILSFECKAKSK